MKEAQEELDKIKIPKEELVASYYHIREQLAELTKQFTSYLVKPQHLLPFLQAGRLVRVRDFDWGMIVNFRRVGGDDRRSNPLKTLDVKIIIDVLVHQVGIEEAIVGSLPSYRGSAMLRL